MRDNDHDITLSQLYALEDNQWPTENQLKIICDFFNIRPEFWLFGINPNILDKLPPIKRALVSDLIKVLLE